MSHSTAQKQREILDRLERGEIDIEGALAAFDDPPPPIAPRTTGQGKKIVLSNIHAPPTAATIDEPPRAPPKIRLGDVRAESTQQSGPIVSLTLHEAEGIALVEMRDDRAANMLSDAVLAGLRDAFAKIEEHVAAGTGKAKVVIITGTDSWFCCGGTPEDLERMREGRASFFDVDGFRLLLDCSLPTIAAMSGHAIGGGFTFGLYADVALLASSSFYSANFMEHGLTPGIGTTYLLPKKLGAAIASEMMLTAQRYQGRELKARNVPLEVLDQKEDVLPRAFAIAREIAKHPLPQIKLLKRRGTEETRRELPRVLREEDEMHAQCFPRQTPPRKTQDSYKTLLIDRRGTRWTVTLHRPAEARNTINQELLDELHRVLDEIEANPNAKILILRGGPPVFCAGLDFEAATTAPTTIAARFSALLQRFTTIPKIVITVVDGIVIGGGVGLIAASDFVFATQTSTFALTEALWGLVPATVLPFIMRRTGFSAAYTMTLSADTISAVAACTMHLVDEVMQTSDALESKCRSFERLETSAINTTKKFFRDLTPPIDEDRSITEINRLLTDPKVRDRIQAFTERGQLPWQTNSTQPNDDRRANEVFEVVRTKILEVLGNNVAPHIRPEVSLTDLGASSLDRMEVVSLSMQALSLRFPVRELGKVSNIGELAAALYEKLR